MKIKSASAAFAAALLLAGCQTTGMDTSGLMGAAAQAAVSSAVAGAAPSAGVPVAAAAASSYANDPVAVAYAQQQAARQGITLSPEQAALALQMAEQQQASGANVNANVIAEAAARQAAATTAPAVTVSAATVTNAVATTAPAGTADGQKSCEQLAAEIAQQQQVITNANGSATNAQVLNAGVSIAQSLGLHFGGIGLGGIQAAGAAGNAAAQQGQAAQQQAQQAEIRLQILSGIHQGKGCAS